MQSDLRTSNGTGVALRLAVGHDEPFLGRLHADRLAGELACSGWPEHVTRSVLDVQLRAQRQGYAAAFPGADDWIVTKGTSPIGRLLLDAAPEAHTIVDVALLTRWRGRGIGAALLGSVLVDAAGAGVPVHLTVRRADERLVAWYGRLGFQVVGENEIHLWMTAG